MSIASTLKLIVALITLCFWPVQSAHSQERARIGISAASLGFLPTVLAEKKGFYSKHGINSEHVLVPCAIATNALLSDDLDYAVCTGPGISGAIKGLPIKLVMTTQDKLGYLLLVKPNVQKLSDLRGKTIGISTFGSQLYLTSVTLFRQAANGTRERYQSPTWRRQHRQACCHGCGKNRRSFCFFAGGYFWR